MKWNKCMVFLLMMSVLILFLGCGCSNHRTSNAYPASNTAENTSTESSSMENNDGNEEKEHDNENDKAEWGAVEDIDTTSDIEDIDKLPLWDIQNDESLSFDFKYEGQEQNYRIIAPEGGNYRFSFKIDNINKSYGYKLCATDHTVIHSGNNSNDFTICLEKGQKYAFKVYQEKGLPKSTINIGVPKPIQKVTDNVISDIFKYPDQEDKYIYNSAIDGIYGIELITNNVQYTYEVRIVDTTNNAEKCYGTSPVDGENQVFLNPELKSGKKYEITVGIGKDIPKDEFKYTLKINTPQEIRKIDSNVVSDNFIFGGQRNKYTFTPTKSAKYEILINDSKEPMEYSVTIFNNNRDKEIVGFHNHDRNVLIDLSEDTEYRIEVLQYREYGEYHFEFVEKQEE